MRQIPSAENLAAVVEGDIGEVDGVLRITEIRLSYEVTVPKGMREKAERAAETHADKCPAYQSVRGCINVTWSLVIREV